MKSFKKIQSMLESLPEIKKVYLLGSTGAGKTSFVRHIIGTTKYAFPTTTQTRTTIAPTEYVIKKDLKFKTTIILKDENDITSSILELIYDAIQKALENKKIEKESIEDIIIKLEESSDERFRLKYMVSKETIKNKAEFIINKILPKIDSLDTNNESLFTDIRNEINFILNDFIEEIKSNFYKVIDNKYTLFSDLPYYIENIEDKEQFINKNKDLLKNDFGSISLLVEYIRIEGNLLSEWLDNEFELVLIDGEGIGHSYGEKRDTLSARHYDFFDFCNSIVLVEKGDDPFLSGGQGAIENIFLNGYSDKFKLIFSKVDKIENLDKSGFLRRRLDNLKDALKKENILLNIENKDTYKFEKLNADKITDYSKKEIRKILTDIKKQKDPEFISLEYDFNLFFSKLDRNDFLDPFNFILNNEHWTIIKALSKRMYLLEDEYKHIKPLSLLLIYIMKEVNDFLQRDDQLRVDVYNSQNKIKQKFSKKLRMFIFNEFIGEKNHLWQQAYEIKGEGSHKKRISFIYENILKSFLPNKEETEKINKFKDKIKQLLLESGVEEQSPAIKIVIKDINIKKIYGEKNFSWTLSDDTNILLGKNGVGKSTILKLIDACINNNKEVFEYYEYPYVELTIEKFYENGKKKEIKINNTKSSSDVKTIFINTFDIKPIENESNGTGLDSKLKELLLKLGTYQRTLELILKDEIKDLQSKYNIILENIKDATQDELLTFQNLSIQIKEKELIAYTPLNNFKSIIDKYLSNTGKTIILNDKNDSLIIKLDNQEIDIKKLSSGEKQLLIIFLNVLLENKPFILLMVEPETSLHVEWQISLIDDLRKIKNNIQIILVTHNPLIMLNRNSSEIGIINNKDIVETDNIGTKKLDVSAVLINYFGLNSLVGKDMREDINNLFFLKNEKHFNFDNFTEEQEETLKNIEKKYKNTTATGFIYNRAYFNFLKFIKENEDIDFSDLEQLSDKDFNLLLNKFKDKF
jgi:ABC-type cobalamin/Fe3+-siderophores transport system ATPase subunit